MCGGFFMSRPNPIRTIMKSSLPSITSQRHKEFRPSVDDVIYAYKILNRYVFYNKLRRPIIELKQTQKNWGYCTWHNKHIWNGSWCTIRLNDKWFCPQWFMNTLAHEMVHQYQWDVWSWDNNLPEASGGHGPSFFMWREQFEYYGLTLKTSFGQRRWFKYQNFNKC